MKKLLVGLLVISMMFFVTAIEVPDIGIGGADVEDIQGVVDDYSPIDEGGDIDLDKYKPFKSKAEERIDNINLWLEENASWLDAVLGMVPALSWLFAINFLIILYALVILVFNVDALLRFFSVLGKKIDLMFFETHWANIFGFGVFVMLLVTKVYVLLAEFLEGLLMTFWNYILPAGVTIAVILVILLFVGGIAGVVFCRKILTAIGQKIIEWEKKKEAKKEGNNREALEKIVKGATGE